MLSDLHRRVSRRGACGRRRRWWEFTDLGTAFSEAFVMQKWRDLISDPRQRAAWAARLRDMTR